MTAVEKFKVGDRWRNGDDTRLILPRDIAGIALPGFVWRYYDERAKEVFRTEETPVLWRQAGWRQLPAETPEPDRLTALEEQVAALTARVGALERPAEAEPTADVPRDCTGREWRPEEGWIIGPACYGSIWRFGGERWVCILSHSGTANVGETTRSVNPPMCRILWPLAEGTEGKR
jgi:hypothetical protein